MMLILQKVYKIQFRQYMNSNTRIQILKDAFGLNLDEGASFLRSVTRQDPDSFLHAIKMCRNLGFTDEDILSNPKLINKKPIIMEQQHMILEEGGFNKISPQILIQYLSIYRKKVVELKLCNYIPSEVNVAESFSKYFDPKPDDGVININQFSDDDRWKDVHTALLKLYLGWRLQATEEEIEKLFRIHSIVKNKSIRLLCENIKLALQVGLSLKRIRTAGYILHGYPNYTKEVLRDYSHIAGGDLKKAIPSCPKLLMISPKNYAKIYGLLKEHKISDETIRNNLNVFQYAPQTVQYRLEEIDKSPELRILKHNNKFLNLVVHHQRAKSRLNYLQELKMKCLPLKLLAITSRIDKHVLIGADLNDSKEVVEFLKSLLKCRSKDLQKSIKKHPHHCSVPLVKMEETYNYLKAIKFTDDAISEVVAILLYPKDNIREILIHMKNDPIYKKAENQRDRLNYVLYQLEKKFHFTGNGIWPQPMEEEMEAT
ncbi:transcription termination factor 5, mitochondrial [Coccinella septempunctata]|uniref:transcription termination factor 5, mitochondrial n=1 Tax=Coccinella septempunctata TaxID=41139 RepID=UPI001D08CD24|nr:transcription termination factor 5, mitochondrial [Coccinella septempunctata]